MALILVMGFKKKKKNNLTNKIYTMSLKGFNGVGGIGYVKKHI